MFFLPAIVLSLLVHVQPAPEAAPAQAVPEVRAGGMLTADASLDDMLDALHRRGQGLTDFDADVKLSDVDPALGDSKDRAGRVLYHVGADGVARLRVTFETLDTGAGPKADRLEYLLDRRVLTDRNYRKKIEVRRIVLREGEKMNLLKLGEGPFPLPIGQEPAEVKRQFVVTRLEPDNGTPRLRLEPREGTRLASRFSQIDVWVDPASRFPTKIETLDANKAAQRNTELRNVRVNPAGGLKDADFALPAIDGQWQTTDEPYRE